MSFNHQISQHVQVLSLEGKYIFINEKDEGSHGIASESTTCDTDITLGHWLKIQLLHL